MTIIVGSLKYSPIFKSHCCAFGKACEERGYEVMYLFGHQYEWMLPKEIKEKTIFIGYSNSISSMLRDTLSFEDRVKIKNVLLKYRPSHVYMHNYHIMNHYLAELSNKLGSSFIYHVHEPFVPNKKPHGGVHQYWLHLFEYLQGKLLEKTDVAVVSSKEASRLFEIRYPNFSGKKMLIPLMYEDLGGLNSSLLNRKFITFVGPPVPAKNPKKFLEIVKYANCKKLNLNFLLISRTPVRNREYFSHPNLNIFYKERITDEEFGELIKRSIAVVAPYIRETQSSVVLVSYMYGTPVISSDVGGLPEFVFHKKTGYLLGVDAKAEEWIEGVRYIKEHLAEMSRNCREYFVQNFSGKNWQKYLDKLLR